MLIDSGTNPREVEKEAVQAKARDAKLREDAAISEAAKLAADAMTAGEAWTQYLQARKEHWSARTYADHSRMTHNGGIDRKRLPGVLTKPGPLVSRVAEFSPTVVVQISPPC
jgi:hypothetical protein